MAILKVVKDVSRDSILRKKSRTVEKIDSRILTLLDDMRETLEEASGVGLAAPQVGVLRRVVVVDNGDKILELINPEIIARDGVQEEIEGCLSCPHKWGITRRPQRVTVKALDRNGNYFTADGEGLIARCFCHETDHLDGVLFTDNVLRMVDEDELEQVRESKK